MKATYSKYDDTMQPKETMTCIYFAHSKLSKDSTERHGDIEELHNTITDKFHVKRDPKLTIHHEYLSRYE